MNKFECRFLSPDGQCQIGAVAKPNKCVDQTITEGVLGSVAWVSFAVTRHIPTCSAKDDIAQQVSCDCFVPKNSKTRAEFLENFQEG